MHAMTCICSSQQDEPIESEEVPSSFEEEESASGEATSPDSPRGRGRQPKGPMPSALKRGPALKTSSMRRKPQLDRITENSGPQPSMKEEDLLQVSCAWSTVHGQHA